MQRRKTEYVIAENLKAKKNEEENRKLLLQKLMERVNAKLNEKVAIKKSVVEQHIIQMEKFGGKNELAKKKVEEIKAKEQEF